MADASESGSVWQFLCTTLGERFLIIDFLSWFVVGLKLNAAGPDFLLHSLTDEHPSQRQIIETFRSFKTAELGQLRSTLVGQDTLCGCAWIRAVDHRTSTLELRLDRYGLSTSEFTPSSDGKPIRLLFLQVHEDPSDTQIWPTRSGQLAVYDRSGARISPLFDVVFHIETTRVFARLQNGTYGFFNRRTQEFSEIFTENLEIVLTNLRLAATAEAAIRAALRQDRAVTSTTPHIRLRRRPRLSSLSD